jgi:hypothetical protein
VAAYLGRYGGESRVHIGSDLRIFLVCCAGQEPDPLTLGRAEIERYVRWWQEVRCYQPSAVSRRLSVVVGFYRVCVIDQILAPATSFSTTTGSDSGSMGSPYSPPHDGYRTHLPMRGR